MKGRAGRAILARRLARGRKGACPARVTTPGRRWLLLSLPRHVLLAADPIAPPSQPTKPGQTLASDPTRSPPPGLDPSPRYSSGYPRPTMVTTTAPPPFLARISAGTEDPRRLPSALLQRLRRGDSNCENQPSCCTAGPGGSARPAVKRVRRKKGKIRPSAAGLLPSRYQQYQQHRAGLGRRTPLGTHGPGELRAHPAPTASAAPGMVTTPPEEPPAPVPSRPAPGKPLRKEVKRGLRHFCSLFAPPPPKSPSPALREPPSRCPPLPSAGGGQRAARPLPSPPACLWTGGGVWGGRVSVTPARTGRGGGGGGRRKRETAGGDWLLGATNGRPPLRPATAGFSLLAAGQPSLRAQAGRAGGAAPHGGGGGGCGGGEPPAGREGCAARPAAGGRRQRARTWSRRS